MRFLICLLVLLVCLLIPNNQDLAQVGEEPRINTVPVEVIEEQDINFEVIDSANKIISFNTGLSEKDAARFSDILFSSMIEYKFIDKDRIIALMFIESRFKEKAVSSAGARGLMQVMPLWTKDKYKVLRGDPLWVKSCKIEVEQLKEAEYNIPCGLYVWNYYRSRSSSDGQALCRYNGACQHCSSCGYSNKVNRVYNKIK
jgi:hypothetical protein